MCCRSLYRGCKDIPAEGKCDQAEGPCCWWDQEYNPRCDPQIDEEFVIYAVLLRARCVHRRSLDLHCACKSAASRWLDPNGGLHSGMYHRKEGRTYSCLLLFSMLQRRGQWWGIFSLDKTTDARSRWNQWLCQHLYGWSWRSLHGLVSRCSGSVLLALLRSTWFAVIYWQICGRKQVLVFGLCAGAYA